MDFNTARFNMVQQQIRPWDVFDPQILELFATIPREQFVPQDFQQLAFSDTFLPIGHNQVIFPPKLTGRILQSLNLRKEHSVLEIGTGTGYLTALLSQLAKRVTTIEIIPELAKEALQNLKSLNLHNITLLIGDGLQTCTNEDRYDVIILTGSLPILPKILREQLSINGKLFAVIGKSPAMSALLLTRINKEYWREKILFETELPPLLYSSKKPGFQF